MLLLCWKHFENLPACVLLQFSIVHHHLTSFPRGSALGFALTAATGCAGLVGQADSDANARAAKYAAIAGPAQVRLLSATEYSNCVQDILGVRVSSAVSHADWGTGFDSGAATTVDENLLFALLSEAERVASQYVAMHLASAFPCFKDEPATPQCALELIAELGRRLLRRPLTAQEQEGLLTLFVSTSSMTNDGNAAEIVLTRLLVSPYFLYRTEVGVGQDVSGTRAMTPFEVATAISFAVTGTAPDDALLHDAEVNAFDADTIRTHVRRLIRTPRGQARLVSFFRGWLRVNNLRDMAEHPQLFGKFDGPELGTALRNEFDRYIQHHIFDGDGSLHSVLQGDKTFVDAFSAPCTVPTSPWMTQCYHSIQPSDGAY